MAGIVITVLIVLLTLYTESQRERAALHDLEHQLEEARKRVGVGRELVDRLRLRLDDEQIQARVNEYGNLEVSADILFDMDQASISSEKEATVLRLGKVVFDMLGDEHFASVIALLTVIGHTDQVGTDDYNRSLSIRRALALADLWYARLPVPEVTRHCLAAKLLIAGMGKARPLVADQSPAACQNFRSDVRGCRANRRIELRITPKDENVSEVPGCP